MLTKKLFLALALKVPPFVGGCHAGVVCTFIGNRAAIDGGPPLLEEFQYTSPEFITSLLLLDPTQLNWCVNRDYLIVVQFEPNNCVRGIECNTS
jgi:hypothetical protein